MLPADSDEATATEIACDPVRVCAASGGVAQIPARTFLFEPALLMTPALEVRELPFVVDNFFRTFLPETRYMPALLA